MKWLRTKVWKLKEGEIAPWPLKWIYYLLFPGFWVYEKQHNLRYDPLRDVYTIRGKEFSGAFFELMKDKSKQGLIVLFKEIGEVTTIETCGEQLLVDIREMDQLLRDLDKFFYDYHCNSDDNYIIQTKNRLANFQNKYMYNDTRGIR